MDKIDKLEGEELARAVAEARGKHMGWTRKESISMVWWSNEDGFTMMQYPKRIGAPPQNYRPDKDIAQSWELDGKCPNGEDWLWSHGSTYEECIVQVEVPRIITAYERWDKHPSKAEAYATARCRVYLKGIAKNKEARS